MYMFEVVTFFSHLVVIKVDSIFQWQYVFIRFMFLLKHFSSNYQNGHQTFQGGVML